MSSAPCQCSPDDRRRIIDAARAAGACAVGFTNVEPLPHDEVARLDRWLALGRHASMTYMERYGDLRADPALLLDDARSMLCVAFSYARSARSPLFADYACGDDYHEVLRSALAPVAELMQTLVPGTHTRICIDSAPLRERYWATRAGLGFIGLNNQLIVPGIGSRVFLAEILWTAATTPDTPLPTTTCTRCGACLRACPGGALDGCGALDSRRCLSYLTIEHRGDLPDGLTLAGRIFGCDICQDVCPHNAVEPPALLPAFATRPDLLALTRDDIIDMTPETFARLFRHSPIKRAKLPSLRRNASSMHNA